MSDSPIRRPKSVPVGRRSPSRSPTRLNQSTGSLHAQSSVRLPPFAGCSPGPLDYNTCPDPGSDCPKYTIQGRNYAPERVDLGPGPGGYNVPSVVGPYTPTKSQSPSYSMPCRALSRDTAPTPGPGYYEDKLTIGCESYFSQNPAFSMLGRNIREENGMPTPGPGAYRQKTLIGNDGMKKSISFRLSIPRGMTTPGPAAYMPKVSGNQPKWTIASRDNGPKQADWYPSPGAGEYSPTHNMVAPASPSFSFGKAQRSASQFDRMMKKKREDARRRARQPNFLSPVSSPTRMTRSAQGHR
eukprot:Rmarinus@m.6013